MYLYDYLEKYMKKARGLGDNLETLRFCVLSLLKDKYGVIENIQVLEIIHFGLLIYSSMFF